MSAFLERFIISLSFLGVILMALYIPGIKKVFGLIGASSANLLAFILPGAFFVKACELKKERAKRIKYLRFFKCMGWTLIIFGMVSMVVCVTS